MEVRLSQAQKNQLQIREKDITDTVLVRVKEMEQTGQLVLPPDYNLGNALKFACLALINAGLMNTDKNALSQTLLDMAIQGLAPQKKQCYFMNFGGKVGMIRSYFGDTVASKRTGLVREIFANCIYEGDVFEIGFDEIGRRIVLKHETKFENLDNPIRGAYAVAICSDGDKRCEIMTKKEIDKAWKMTKNPNNNKLQTEFPQQACKRTVIRRLTKMIINTSTDSNLIIESVARTSCGGDFIDDAVDADFEETSTQAVQEKIQERAASVEFKEEDVEKELDASVNEEQDIFQIRC